MEEQDFCRRLSALRLQKGISARNMSLSLGQSTSYINNIENGINLPSMTMFFYICEFLEITPTEFFDIDNNNPLKSNQLWLLAKKLNDTQLDALITLTKELVK